MELVTKKKLAIISGRANHDLAAEIAEVLGEELVEPNIADFANGEIHCRFEESVGERRNNPCAPSSVC